ncbi:MAG: hypothetical protein RMM17_13315 [Acidobacteriota bacterium]|nr:hypothetical protein [Blastocatellia bacterium]MDW8413647.1 hypothetical protein [Acidobacteriota bacterium]
MIQKTICLSSVTHVDQFIGKGQLVAFNAGPDGITYFVMALEPLDYKEVSQGGAGFPKTIPDKPQLYRVVGMSGARIVLDVMIEDEHFNIHHVQPLSNELLLVCARSRYHGPDNFEKNGRIYTRSGKFAREILLGDGIRSVQATASGTIWTSYFDEGIFGSYGWDDSDPVGASGLVAWDAAGNKLYSFRPCGGLAWIDDCYALNVASENDVWLYYYSQFPLVHLYDRQIQSFWKVPLQGSSAFAVSAGYALFCGGYGDRDTYHLFSIDEGKDPTLLATITLQDRNGEMLKANSAVGRADVIYFISSNGFVYRFDVHTALAG